MATHRPPERARASEGADRPPLRPGPAGAGPPPARRRRWLKAVAIGLGAVIFGFMSGFALRGSGPQIATTGPPQDAFLGATARDDLLFRITSDLPSLMDTAKLDYDDGDVIDQAHVGDGRLTFRPRDLAEGTHTLDFSMDQPFVPWPVRRSWTFTVDTDRPDIKITGPTRPAVRGAPVTLTGIVSEPSRVTVDDSEVKVDGGGHFSVTFPTPPATAVAVRATDRAGNVRGVRTEIPVAAREPMKPIRAVHMTAISWAVPYLREPVLAMLRAGQINAIELDLKDESGVIGYDSTVPLGVKIGAVQPEYEIRKAVKQIHDLGGRVIGRIVAFRDPILATYAWGHGDREQVIQAPGGTEYRGYGGFTNFSDPVVRQYNIDIAMEAAGLGVDDILYDYVRRPDGPLDTMVFPGLKGGAQASIVSFLRNARSALDPTGAFLGASLFGIAADRPEEVAQNVPEIARNVDYVAPLIYPSHWGPGVYGVAEPEREPKKIIEESLIRFNKLTAGTGARVVPWLQDFSLAVHYGPKEVCAQIDGAKAENVHEYIMWDALVTYTKAACLTP